MNDQIRVIVRIFAAPALALESQECKIKLSKDATVEDLLKLVPLESNYIYIVREGIRLTKASALNDGDEILIVPPIAGG